MAILLAMAYQIPASQVRSAFFSGDLKKCPTRSTRRDLVGQMAILLAMAYQIPDVKPSGFGIFF